MSQIYICGLGAVSPAGWGVDTLCAAVEKGVPVPEAPLQRPGWTQPLPVRQVPACTPRPAYFGHARLRRTSPVTQHAAGAAVEAMGQRPRSSRLGLVLCLQAGCVQYSERFYAETLKDPSTASPLLFPETVLSAPASHIATVLGGVQEVHTLTGDAATFLQGLAIGADWLIAGRVDQCLVLGAEEVSWLVSDAYRNFDKKSVGAGGAGAVLLGKDPAFSIGVALDAITDSCGYTLEKSRLQAAQQMRSQLPAAVPGELLCDGLQNRVRTDAPERAAWSNWSGPRLSPKLVLGEGLTAAAAWQCVIACHAVATRSNSAAITSVVGLTQQAIGARFVRVRGDSLQDTNA